MSKTPTENPNPNGCSSLPNQLTAFFSYCLRNARWGTKFPNDLPLKDSLWETLTDSFCKMPMANTAEKLAAQFGITRAQCDEFALRSQV